MNRYVVLLDENNNPYIEITRKDKSVEILEGFEVIKFLGRIDEALYGRKARRNPFTEKEIVGNSLIYINKVTGKNIRIPNYMVTTTQILKMYEDYREEYEKDKQMETVKGFAKVGVMIGALALIALSHTAQKEIDIERTGRYDEEKVREYSDEDIKHLEEEEIPEWNNDDEFDYRKDDMDIPTPSPVAPDDYSIFEPTPDITVEPRKDLDGEDMPPIWEPIPEEEHKKDNDRYYMDPKIEEPVPNVPEGPTVPVPTPIEPKVDTPVPTPATPDIEAPEHKPERRRNELDDPRLSQGIIDVEQKMITDQGKIEQNKQLIDDIAAASRKRGISFNIINDIISQEWSGKEKNIMHIIPGSWLEQIITVHNYETDKDEKFVITDNPSAYQGKVDFTITRQELENRSTNVRVGTSIVQYCLNKYDYNILLGLQAYNNGITAVDKVLDYTANKTGVPKESIIADITNTTWMEYVDDVIKFGDPDYAKNVLKRETDYDQMFTITEEDMENYASNVAGFVNTSADKVYTVQSLDDNGEVVQESQGYRLK